MNLTTIIIQFFGPPMVFIWLALIGIVYKRKYMGRICMITGILFLWLSSIPAVGIFISRPLLATDTKWTIKAFDGADAIVVATGGYFVAEKRFFSTELSLRRGDYGAWLHKETELPMVITGGRTFHPDAPSESIILRDRLGLNDDLVFAEETSQNSYEHSFFLQKFFEKKGWGRKIVLVSSAMHMVRLSAVFRARGFDVIPVSVNDQTTFFRDQKKSWETFFPSLNGLAIFHRAFYSYSGIFSYLIRGRFDFSDLFHEGQNFLAPPSPWLSRS